MESGDKTSDSQRVQMVIVPKNKPAATPPPKPATPPTTDPKPASDQH
jgi:hypothetical protein